MKALIILIFLLLIGCKNPNTERIETLTEEQAEFVTAKGLYSPKHHIYILCADVTIHYKIDDFEETLIYNNFHIMADTCPFTNTNIILNK